MSSTDLERTPETVRGELVDARFDDAVDADPTPLLDLIDGRATNDDLAPGECLEALEACGGRVALYFGLPADDEWWLGYDSTWDVDGDRGEYGLNGPFVCWSTYPSGGWSRQRKARAIVETNIEDQGKGVDGSEIRRSRMVRLQDAPEFVRDALE